VARPAQQVASAAWGAEDVGLDRVQRELRRLGAEVTRSAHGEESEAQIHAHGRASVMNLVIVADEPVAAARAAMAVEMLSERHPSRAIVIVQRRPEAAPRLDATVKCSTADLEAMGHIQFEQVWLELRGPHGDLAGVVDPLLMTDVPSYVWWIDGPPAHVSRGLVELADGVAVDSAAARDAADLRRLARLAGSKLGDLQWARLRPWRAALAQLFNPADRRPCLAEVDEVVLEHEPSPGARLAALLTFGWLATALDWPRRGGPRRRVLPTGGAWPGFRRLALRSRAACTAEVALDETGCLRVSYRASGRTVAQALPLGDPAPEDLLIDALTAGLPDLPYLSALERALGR
jgi:glucose-6-phosphate dehydrogenase assembly protein OpcA